MTKPPDLSRSGLWHPELFAAVHGAAFTVADETLCATGVDIATAEVDHLNWAEVSNWEPLEQGPNVVVIEAALRMLVASNDAYSQSREFAIRNGHAPRHRVPVSIATRDFIELPRQPDIWLVSAGNAFALVDDTLVATGVWAATNNPDHDNWSDILAWEPPPAGAPNLIVIEAGLRLLAAPNGAYDPVMEQAADTFAAQQFFATVRDHPTKS